MNDKKKRKLNIICTVIIITLAIISCVYDMKFDYRLVTQDGKHYFVFENPQEYGVLLWSSEDDPFSQHLYTQVIYPSGQELIRAVKLGNLTKDDKEAIAKFYREDNGRIVMFDFENFYEPILPKGWNTTQVKWTGRIYVYNFENGDHYGAMALCDDQTYQEVFQFAWEEYYERGYVQVSRTEYLEEGKKEVIYYSDNSSAGQSEQVNYYKCVRYSLNDKNRTIYVEKKYSLPSEELQDISLFVTDGTQGYTMDFSATAGDISDETLLQFGIKKVNVVSPWVVTGAFLSVSALGFVLYKKFKKRKEAQVA